MSSIKHLVYAVIRFLREQSQMDAYTSDEQESLEVAIQCLETVFKISPEDTHLAVSQPLTEMFTSSFCKVSRHCFLLSIWFKYDSDNYVELLTFERLGLYVTNFFLGVS